MKIGIVGTNPRALAIGRLLVSGKHDVTVSDPCSDRAAEREAAEIGTSAETPYQQAMTREVGMLACPRDQVDAVVTAMGGSGECVIVDALEGGPDQPHHGAQLLARKFDTHHLVRALIVLPQTGANIPICGDDPSAKSVLTEALEACGCLTSDHGPLSRAAELEPQERPRVAA